MCLWYPTDPFLSITQNIIMNTTYTPSYRRSLAELTTNERISAESLTKVAKNRCKGAFTICSGVARLGKHELKKY